MTENASSRNPMCFLGSLRLGDWAQETSDRGVPPVIGKAVEKPLTRHQTARLRGQR
jgi:hypothetical protein